VNNNLPYLINLPPFIFRGADVENFSFFKKITFIVRGKILSLIINKLSGKSFCNLINFFYSDSNISFSNNLYHKSLNGKNIVYPNKRVLRLVNNPELSLNNIYEAYCLNHIDISNQDLIVDCGANVGELNLALSYKNIDVNYKAFEPDEMTFKCLVLNNNENPENEFFNLGLSNLNGSTTFYLDNEGGNSSLVNFGSNQTTEIETKTLDSFKFENIKVLKIDAEGFEPEVLEGSVNTLKGTEFVSIDFGAERGLEQNKTIIEVNDLLYENNFRLVKFSDFRFIGLYKNINF
tara:strand:- start:753 stop:1625 length:873 start_codon:yes stop_codon:yes gene_type:complete